MYESGKRGRDYSDKENENKRRKSRQDPSPALLIEDNAHEQEVGIGPSNASIPICEVDGQQNSHRVQGDFLKIWKYLQNHNNFQIDTLPSLRPISKNNVRF